MAMAPYTVDRWTPPNQCDFQMNSIPRIVNLDSLRARALFMWLVLLPLAVLVFIAAILMRPGHTASSDLSLTPSTVQPTDSMTVGESR